MNTHNMVMVAAGMAMIMDTINIMENLTHIIIKDIIKDTIKDIINIINNPIVTKCEFE